jgi:hypothetical protein
MQFSTTWGSKLKMWIVEVTNSGELEQIVLDIQMQNPFSPRA